MAAGTSCAATTTMIDPFGDGNVLANTDGTVPSGWDGTYQTVITDAAGGGAITETGGVQSYNAGSQNWTRSELHSNQNYAFPAAGESTTFTWEVGNINVSTGIAGADFRTQMNAISASRLQGTGSERWLVTEGVLSLDLFYDGADGSTSIQAFTKNSATAANNNGDPRNTTAVTSAQWDWTTTANIFTLEITDTGYTWSDSVTGFNFTETYATAPGFGDGPDELTGGFWPFFDMQNNDGGRGTGDLNEFTATVVTVPEPGSAILSLLALGVIGLRRRR